jgi:hypothetical protein
MQDKTDKNNMQMKSCIACWNTKRNKKLGLNVLG